MIAIMAGAMKMAPIEHGLGTFSSPSHKAMIASPLIRPSIPHSRPGTEV